MKLIEAMKKQRVIEKKIAENTKSINQYASMTSNERPYFDTEQAQKAKVRELIQANIDLMKEYLWLKRCVETTNLETTMEMGGKNYTLSELLIIKRKMGALMLQTFNALNDGAAQIRLAQFRGQTAEGKTPTVMRYYQENDKIEGKREYQDLLDNIESRLEVHNAITELIEVPHR
jgi:hypothetical protein